MTRPMTIAEKILAKHAGLKEVKPGQLITAKLDITLANDITGPVAIREFKKIGVKNVFDKDRVVFVPDHFVPNKDIKSAQQAKIVREFAQEQNLTNYFEVGRMGIEHALLPEKGIVTAGDLIIGADSHTCTYGALGAFSTGVGSTDLGCAMASGETWFKVPSTIKVEFNGQLKKWVSAKDLILHLIGDIGVDGALYKVLEIGGDTISSMEMDGRLTICNMAIEAGAKTGIIVPDEITKKYLENRTLRQPVFYTSDENAQYEILIDSNYNNENLKITGKINYEGLQNQNVKETYEIGLESGAKIYNYKLENNIAFGEGISIEDFTTDNSMVLTNYENEAVNNFLVAVEERIIEVNKQQMQELGVEEDQNPLLRLIPDLGSYTNLINSFNKPEVSKEDVATFNNKFEVYQSTNLQGVTVKGLLSTIQLNNEQQDETRQIKEINFNGEEYEVNGQNIAAIKEEVVAENYYRVEFERDQETGLIYRAVINPK